VDKKITVDLFLFAQSQFDVATVGEVHPTHILLWR
jgi:hypothetical protein